MVFRMLAVLAEFERDLISERTLTALAHKKANGEKTGGHVTFGQRVRLTEDGTKMLTPDAGEQKTVDQIVQLRRTGSTYLGIAETLNDQGVASKRGGLWSAKVVRCVYLRSA